jgi:hypothetical protein
VDQVAAAVGMCARAGVTPLASFILGLPGETPETIRETMQFARRLEDQGLLYGFHLLAPFPGTEVRERAAELGLRILSSDWSAYHANRAVAETESVSRRMLDEIAVEWEDRYNRYLGDIRERMQRGTAAADEAYQVTNLERIVCTYDLMMKGIVERAGTWPEREGSGGGDERVLVERVQSAAGGDAAAVRDAIEAAIRQDHLICERDRGRVRWRWRDELTH